MAVCYRLLDENTLCKNSLILARISSNGPRMTSAKEKKGKTIEACREMLEDALHEMVLAYIELKKEIPRGRLLFEPITVEVPAAAGL